MNKKISLSSLVLLVVAAIDSIRNLPATAIFGSSLLFFFLFSAIVFLIPISMISAEFTARSTEKGGVFHWIRDAFGDKLAVLGVWLQWINTLIWYPTILSFIAGTFAYLFDPVLAQDKRFLLSVILIVFWGLTFLNLRGIHVSLKMNTICGIFGLLIPMCFLIVMGVLWIFTKKPIAIQWSVNSIFPSFSGLNNWTSLIAIMASFVGMELAGVHVGDIKDPQKNFPKAMGISVVLLLSTMILGALSIAIVIPKENIRLVDGIMQTFTQFFHAFGIAWCIPILTLLIIVGSIGGMINWLISPAKGLLQAADLGFMPKFFAKTNKQEVPTRLLVLQGIIVSFFCLAFVLMPSINAFYWFLTCLSTELYMIMYLLLFLAALKIGRPKEVYSYHMPKGTRYLACFLGIFGAILTIVVGCFPPTGIDVGSPLRYAQLIIFGNLISIAPVFLLWRHKKRSGGR